MALSRRNGDGKENNMLKSHFDAIERYLLALSQIQENTGHSLHKGSPRESFVKEFLVGHLSEQITIGTGEIIDVDSKPGESRNQFDIVIYRKDFPKIDFGGGINGFLAESVVATIEVKSTLRKGDLMKSICAANNAKKLKNSIFLSSSTINRRENIQSFVVAYDGPKKMKTVYKWIGSIYSNFGYVYPDQPSKKYGKMVFPSLSLDGIFVLGKGFVQYHSARINFLSEEHYDTNPDTKWEIIDSSTGNLFMFFLTLMLESTNVLNPLPYAKSFSIPDENIFSGN